MPPMTPLLYIDYDEGEQQTYRAVALMQDAQTDYYRAASGDPVADFAAVVAFAKARNLEVNYSSQCDNFLMDGDGYEYAQDLDGWPVYRRKGGPLLVETIRLN